MTVERSTTVWAYRRTSSLMGQIGPVRGTSSSVRDRKYWRDYESDCPVVHSIENVRDKGDIKRSFFVKRHKYRNSFHPLPFWLVLLTDIIYSLIKIDTFFFGWRLGYRVMSLSTRIEYSQWTDQGRPYTVILELISRCIIKRWRESRGEKEATR